MEGRFYKDIAKNIKKTISFIYLRIHKSWTVSADLLEKSFDNDKSPVYYDDNSKIVELIKNNQVFNSRIDAEINKPTNNNYFTISETMSFDSGDLFGSLHDCHVDAEGVKTPTGMWDISVKIYDYYDFEFKKSNYKEMGLIVGTANNYAAALQDHGLISNYDIYINFKITR